MEYSFKRDDIDQPIAALNMEAEAFGHWLSIEMGERNVSQVAQVIEAVSQLLAGSRWQYQLQGREFSLQLTRDQAVVQANALMQKEEHYGHANELADYLDDEFSAGGEFDDDDELAETSAGLSASSGLEDFGQLMRAWSDFIKH